ncbi:MAG: hypothetical protein U0R64_10920 [Candidatus Nanopelagicales bacterium]
MGHDRGIWGAADATGADAEATARDPLSRDLMGAGRLAEVPFPDAPVVRAGAFLTGFLVGDFLRLGAFVDFFAAVFVAVVRRGAARPAGVLTVGTPRSP